MWPALWLIGTLWEGYSVVVEDRAVEHICLSLNSHSAASTVRYNMTPFTPVVSLKKVVFT